MSPLRRLHEDCRGLEGVEYLLIAALVMIAAIGSWKYLGKTVSRNVIDEANTIDQTVSEAVQGTLSEDTGTDGKTIDTGDKPPSSGTEQDVAKSGGTTPVSPNVYNLRAYGHDPTKIPAGGIGYLTTAGGTYVYYPLAPGTTGDGVAPYRRIFFPAGSPIPLTHPGP